MTAGSFSIARNLRSGSNESISMAANSVPGVSGRQCCIETLSGLTNWTSNTTCRCRTSGTWTHNAAVAAPCFRTSFGGLLEIPLTATQDYSLFHILRDYRLDLWKSQAAGVAARNGLLSFIVHPDYLLDSRARKTYCGLLEFLSQCRSEQGMWIATANELNTWCRLRNQMSLVERHGSWHIDGPGCERARVAFARIRNGQFRYFPEGKAPEIY